MQAEDRYFIGLPSGGTASWNEPSNWTGASLPGPDARVFLKYADEFDRHVLLDVAASIGSLSIGNSGGGLATLYQSDSELVTPYEVLGIGVENSRGAHIQDAGTNSVGYLKLADYTWNRTASGSYVLNNGVLNASVALDVAYGGRGVFLQNGGTVNANTLRIGLYDHTTGTYLLDRGTLNVKGAEYLGFVGAGTFIQSGGTHTIGGVLSLGLDSTSGCSGTYILNGADATLISSTELMGRHNPGTFIQSAGNHLVQSECIVGYLNNGQYDLSGGSLNVMGELHVGLYGDGTFNQSGGTVTVSEKLSAGYLLLGTSGGLGTYNLTGTSASLSVWGTEYVGYDGRGTFYQSAGSHSVSDVLDIGGTALGGQCSHYQLEGGSLEVGNEVLVGVYGPGRFTQSGGVFSTPKLTVGSGATFTWSGGSLSISALSLGGHMSLAAGSGRTLVVNSLKIDPFAANALDLADNAFVSDYAGTSPLPTIKQYITSSRLFSSLAIPGVTGLGYDDDGSRVLVRYSYFGDTDLNGTVDLIDFGHFLDGFSPAEAEAQWTTGDFNYSLTVDLTDFELYLGGYYALGGSVEGITHAVNNAPVCEPDRAAMLNLIATVPEPGGIMLLALLAPWSLFGRAHNGLKRPRRC